jgi:hypothetical protein
MVNIAYCGENVFIAFQICAHIYNEKYSLEIDGLFLLNYLVFLRLEKYI